MLQITGHKFTYHRVEVKEQFLVLVTCNACGTGKICSEFDKALKQWEQSHSCDLSRGSLPSLRTA
jgi:hypothetical protein